MIRKNPEKRPADRFSENDNRKSQSLNPINGLASGVSLHAGTKGELSFLDAALDGFCIGGRLSICLKEAGRILSFPTDSYSKFPSFLFLTPAGFARFPDP